MNQSVQQVQDIDIDLRPVESKLIHVAGNPHVYCAAERCRDIEIRWRISIISILSMREWRIAGIISLSAAALVAAATSRAFINCFHSALLCLQSDQMEIIPSLLSMTAIMELMLLR